MFWIVSQVKGERAATFSQQLLAVVRLYTDKVGPPPSSVKKDYQQQQRPQDQQQKEHRRQERQHKKESQNIKGNVKREA